MLGWIVLQAPLICAASQSHILYSENFVMFIDGQICPELHSCLHLCSPSPSSAHFTHLLSRLCCALHMLKKSLTSSPPCIFHLLTPSFYEVLHRAACLLCLIFVPTEPLAGELSEEGFSTGHLWLHGCCYISCWLSVRGKAVHVKYLDFGKVFHTVSHDVLISNLGKRGLYEITVRWVDNWLNDCTQWFALRLRGHMWWGPTWFCPGSSTTQYFNLITWIIE